MTLSGITISTKMMVGNSQLISNTKLRSFHFSELKTATRNFSNDTILGEGGFGTVYKGWFKEESIGKQESGSVVAVKNMQGFEEWQSEVNFLGRFSHPNLVKLLGYCWEDDELLLVYEFMQKGTLESHLLERGSVHQPLSWDIRLKILIGAARGLAFLHTSGIGIIHKDFKTSNILLDGVMGTYGYAAPEYVATGHLYVKSDVYGFGVILVEMLTGLRELDTKRPAGQHNLVDWVKPYLPEMDRLKKNYTAEDPTAVLYTRTWQQMRWLYLSANLEIKHSVLQLLYRKVKQKRTEAFLLY
ncbi:Serine/threonine protein kinase [Handroanthus impetiginosus]|uniref:non-specific serine/threonine protein kinase n=1 Tax=Handroanthus impetiginosus TaxID=429701 RepID=A0A2G9GMA6_9LAMI|nr:Serine/threonine protein kinase [Handroanthus impetiginosus]